MIGLECTCKGEYSTGEWPIHCIPCPAGTIYTWYGCVACPNGYIEVDGVCVFGTYTGSSRLMRISLLRISLLRFFKTFHTHLANVILCIFC